MVKIDDNDLESKTLSKKEKSSFIECKLCGKRMEPHDYALKNHYESEHPDEELDLEEYNE